MRETELVLLAVSLAELTPVSGCVALKEWKWILASGLKCLEYTWCCYNLAEREFGSHVDLLKEQSGSRRTAVAGW